MTTLLPCAPGGTRSDHAHFETMNIREDIRELKTGDRELRKFGLAVGTG